MNVYPLVLSPLLKRRVWGGQRLQALLGKNLPAGESIGESWEIADLDADQTLVSNGPATGWPLRRVVEEWGDRLVATDRLVDGRFPLLLKYLDATDRLSVQVHPSPAQAAAGGSEVRLKNEAWYVLSADDGAVIYRGLRDGVSPAEFEAAVRSGTCADLLNSVPARAGECYYLPSGTVHALGSGIVVAEVQTPSDVTYRLFDWNRVDAATGKARDLHITEALASMVHEPPDESTERRTHVASVWTTVTRLVTCESFIIERIRMIEGFDQAIPYAQMVIWMVLEGACEIRWSGGRDPLTIRGGDTVILPAGLENGRLRTLEDCVWLEITLPGMEVDA